MFQQAEEIFKLVKQPTWKFWANYKSEPAEISSSISLIISILPACLPSSFHHRSLCADTICCRYINAATAGGGALLLK